MWGTSNPPSTTLGMCASLVCMYGVFTYWRRANTVISNEQLKAELSRALRLKLAEFQRTNADERQALRKELQSAMAAERAAMVAEVLGIVEELQSAMTAECAATVAKVLNVVEDVEVMIYADRCASTHELNDRLDGMTASLLATASSDALRIVKAEVNAATASVRATASSSAQALAQTSKIVKTKVEAAAAPVSIHVDQSLAELEAPSTWRQLALAAVGGTKQVASRRPGDDVLANHVRPALMLATSLQAAKNELEAAKAAAARAYVVAPSLEVAKTELEAASPRARRNKRLSELAMAARFTELAFDARDDKGDEDSTGNGQIDAPSSWLLQAEHDKMMREQSGVASPVGVRPRPCRIPKS